MAETRLRITAPGVAGVNVDADPLTLQVTELQWAQNATHDTTQGHQGAIRKRPGLGAWSPSLGAPILGGLTIPTQDTGSTLPPTSVPGTGSGTGAPGDTPVLDPGIELGGFQIGTRRLLVIAGQSMGLGNPPYLGDGWFFTTERFQDPITRVQTSPAALGSTFPLSVDVAPGSRAMITPVSGISCLIFPTSWHTASPTATEGKTLIQFSGYDATPLGRVPTAPAGTGGWTLHYREFSQFMGMGSTATTASTHLTFAVVDLYTNGANTGAGSAVIEYLPVTRTFRTLRTTDPGTARPMLCCAVTGDQGGFLQSTYVPELYLRFAGDAVYGATLAAGGLAGAMASVWKSDFRGTTWTADWTPGAGWNACTQLTVLGPWLFAGFRVNVNGVSLGVSDPSVPTTLVWWRHPVTGTWTALAGVNPNQINGAYVNHMVLGPNVGGLPTEDATALYLSVHESPNLAVNRIYKVTWAGGPSPTFTVTQVFSDNSARYPVYLFWDRYATPPVLYAWTATVGTVLAANVAWWTTDLTTWNGPIALPTFGSGAQSGMIMWATKPLA